MKQSPRLIHPVLHMAQLGLCGLLVTFALVFVAIHEAQADVVSIKVCNTGNIKFSVAVVRADWGLIYPDEFYGEGWFNVAPGTCESGLDYRGRTGSYFLAFLQRDRSGQWGIAVYEPASETGWFSSSNRSFCVKLDAFEYEESGKPTQKCPAPWFLAPFPYNIRVVTGSHDVEVNIDASSSASLIPIPTEPEENSSAKPAAPPPPPSPPPPPPKPGWLGIGVTEVKAAEIGSPPMLTISTVIEGSPATRAEIAMGRGEKARLIKGDMIKRVFSKGSLKPKKPQTFDELNAALQEIEDGDPLMFHISREGKDMYIDVTAEERPGRKLPAKTGEVLF